LISDAVVRKLEDIVGSENVSTSPTDLHVYSYDASIAHATPDVIVWPQTTEQVSQIMKLAYEEEIPVTPRGAGSCLSGGPLPLKGGISITMTKMTRILDLNPNRLQVSVEPGVVVDRLNEYLQPHGLFYPINPASSSIATIGGCVGEDAGPLRGVKYGTTKNWVLGLEVVLPNGKVIHVGSKTFKHVAGYDLVRLMVGSEGTLGIFTKINLRLAPIPEAVAVASAFFDSADAAGKGVRDAILSGVDPSGIELMERAVVEAASKHAGLKLPQAEFLILYEIAGSKESIEPRVRKLTKVLKEAGATAVDVAYEAEERARLWKARKAAFPALSRLRPTCIMEDVAVPIDNVGKLLEALRSLAKKHDVMVATFGHAGDGDLHPTITTDERDEEEMKRVAAFRADMYKAVVDLEGTITGEHGVGITKKPYLKLQFREDEIEVMRSIKRAIDPKNILNPGKII